MRARTGVPVRARGLPVRERPSLAHGWQHIYLCGSYPLVTSGRMSGITSGPSTKASPSSSSNITNCVTAPLPKHSHAPNATSPPNHLRRGHSQPRLRRQHLRHRHLPPYRQPACQRLHWLCLGPPPSQRRPSTSHSHRTPHRPLRLLPRPLRHPTRHQALRWPPRLLPWRRTRPTRGLAPPPSPRRHAPHLHLLTSPGGSRQLSASSSP